jgi:hypothetical protein
MLTRNKKKSPFFDSTQCYLIPAAQGLTHAQGRQEPGEILRKFREISYLLQRNKERNFLLFERNSYSRQVAIAAAILI